MNRIVSPTHVGTAASDEPTLRNEDESWTVIGDDPHNLHVVQAANHDLRVCFLTSNGPTERRGRLIAAAPDLLAALKEMYDQMWHLAKDKGSNPWLKQARAAIAKAEEGLAMPDNILVPTWRVHKI